MHAAMSLAVYMHGSSHTRTESFPCRIHTYVFCNTKSMEKIRANVTPHKHRALLHSGY